MYENRTIVFFLQAHLHCNIQHIHFGKFSVIRIAIKLFQIIVFRGSNRFDKLEIVIKLTIIFCNVPSSTNIELQKLQVFCIIHNALTVLLNNFLSEPFKNTIRTQGYSNLLICGSLFECLASLHGYGSDSIDPDRFLSQPKQI